MSWLKLDDSFADHDKVVGLSDAAFRLHVHSMLRCAKLRTDGFVATGALPRLTSHRRPIDLATELVEAKVWEVQPGGYLVHDFLDYNPSKAQQEKAEAERSERGRRAAGARWSRMPDACPTHAHSIADGNAEAVPNHAPSRSRPDPDPVLERSSPSEKLSPRARRAGSEAGPVDAVLDHYATLGQPFGKQRPRSEGARAKIAARLKRYSIDELRTALTNLFASPWHNGTDPQSQGRTYLEIEQVVRADDRVEKFRDMSARAPIGGPRPPMTRSERERENARLALVELEAEERAQPIAATEVSRG